jgi:hypothetical protein
MSIPLSPQSPYYPELVERRQIFLNAVCRALDPCAGDELLAQCRVFAAHTNTAPSWVHCMLRGSWGLDSERLGALQSALQQKDVRGRISALGIARQLADSDCFAGEYPSTEFLRRMNAAATPQPEEVVEEVRKELARAAELRTQAIAALNTGLQRLAGVPICAVNAAEIVEELRQSAAVLQVYFALLVKSDQLRSILRIDVDASSLVLRFSKRSKAARYPNFPELRALEAAG